MLFSALLLVVCVASGQAALGPCHAELSRIDGKSPVASFAGRFRPRCSANGDYEPQQCYGSVCYCVSSGGNKLGFENNIGLASAQTCLCARDQAEYFDRKILGRVFHCDSLGSYEKVQCMGSVCYCADKFGKALLGKATKHISKSHELDC